MLSALLTQVAFWLCLVVFVRLFTYQRGNARFRRGMSCAATAIMGCAGAAMLHIIQGKLHIQPAAWPVVGLLAAFAWSVVSAGGNLAGVVRAEEEGKRDAR